MEKSVNNKLSFINYVYLDYSTYNCYLKKGDNKKCIIIRITDYDGGNPFTEVFDKSISGLKEISEDISYLRMCKEIHEKYKPIENITNCNLKITTISNII
jgi:hypothetical protein